jgi:hypothetical protein
LDLKLRVGAVLKGHGFSRAECQNKRAPALAAEGWFSPLNSRSGAKAQDFLPSFAARLKPCPFKTIASDSNAFALGAKALVTRTPAHHSNKSTIPPLRGSAYLINT